MRPTDPTQADVLRDRASRVPWRRAARETLLGLVGRGPMSLPDRLEGAVYGHLLGSMAAGEPDDELLEQLRAHLDGRTADAGPPARGGAAGAALAAVLAAPDDPSARLAALTTSAADAGTEGDSLYGHVVRRLLAGERNGRSALAAARRASGLGRGQGRDLSPAFGTAWRAFEASRDPVDALARVASEGGDPQAAPIAGGLAGARWGSSSIPTGRRRAVPSPAGTRAIVDRLIEQRAPGPGGATWQTSTSIPLAVHDIDLTGLGLATGAVGITPLPGRRYVAYHTGAHWRDLDADAARLRELGIDRLFLLVEDRELARCGVTAIPDVLAGHGISLVRHPIPDPLVPRDGVAFRTSVARVLADVARGQRVAVACRGGLDRAGMTTACLLREAGLDASAAIERVQRARPGALTLPDQQAYVRAWPPAG